MNTSEIIVSSASNSDESLHSYNDEEYDCEVDQENTYSSVSSSDCSSVEVKILLVLCTIYPTKPG